MPGAGGSERYRFVVDESSFDFRDFQGLDGEQLTDLLDDFSDTLAELREKHPVARSPWWSEVECADGLELCQFLYEGGDPKAGRDARLRMATLMDRCPSWDPGSPGLPDQVDIGGTVRELALSLGYALSRTMRGYSVGCLVFTTPGEPGGWRAVSCADGAAEVYFFTEASTLTHFWRELFIREDVREPDFFDRAKEAFPGLVFANSLTFNRFDGSYLHLRDWTVHVLAVVHDHFPEALAKHPGNLRGVQAELGRYGLRLSPESALTRSKPKIMRQRDVEHEGEIYHCEWHGKQRPDRNRVHFSLPEPRLGDRILIGIFVNHLDTE